MLDELEQKVLVKKGVEASVGLSELRWQASSPRGYRLVLLKAFDLLLCSNFRFPWDRDLKIPYLVSTRWML